VTVYIGGGAPDHGLAHRTDDFAGAALSLQPGVMPDEEALGAVMVRSLSVELGQGTATTSAAT
jgi:hypothetical protein